MNKEKKKHIYLIGSNISKIGGTQRVSVNLANEFIKKYDVTIINVGKNTFEEYFDLDKKINIVYLNLEKKLNKYLFFILMFFKIKKYLKQKHCSKNIYIGIGISYSYILGLLNFLNSTKIGTQHNPIKNSWIGNKVKSYILNKLSYNVVISKEMLKQTKIQFKLKNCIYISNFINIPSIKKNIKKEYCLAIGRFTEQKGFDILIKIWKNIIDSGMKEKLLIVGEGPLEDELKKQIKKELLENYVEIHPSTKNIKELYLKSKVYLMTSRHEGMPMVLLEAQSFQIPIISFDCPTGPKEIIENGCNGYLIPCFNIELFSDYLIKYLKNKETQDLFSKSSKNKIQEFSKKNIMKKWNNILENKKQIKSRER